MFIRRTCSYRTVQPQRLGSPAQPTRIRSGYDRRQSVASELGQKTKRAEWLGSGRDCTGTSSPLHNPSLSMQGGEKRLREDLCKMPMQYFHLENLPSIPPLPYCIRRPAYLPTLTCTALLCRRFFPHHILPRPCGLVGGRGTDRNRHLQGPLCVWDEIRIRFCRQRADGKTTA